ncbi:MAG TPA: RNA chaperone Hfq [bacterium]|nr:RNA chaperone Hfq [bacterium]
MPSEVFAEDLEALLEGLEGVAAARVVATDAGEVDRIYVTAGPGGDEARIRDAVAAALMSRYSLAVDARRIRVARLRDDQPTRPRWYMQRVEEVLTATESRVTVELHADEGTVATLIGRAKGSTDPAGRLRTAAQAALDALKSVFEAEDRRVTVESIASVSLAAGRAIVVALAASGGGSSERYVGSALVEGSDAEAVIAAALDAVSKRGSPVRRRGWMMRDRREELESMEAYYRRVREPQRQMPRPAAPAAAEADEDVVPAARLRPSGEASAAGGLVQDGWSDEAATPMEQVRPERQGGAEVAQPMNRFAPKGSMEDEFFRHLVTTGIPVHIRCRDGYEILGGVLRDFGTYSLIVETEAGKELVFKHGIITIRPLSARAV